MWVRLIIQDSCSCSYSYTIILCHLRVRGDNYNKTITAGTDTMLLDELGILCSYYPLLSSAFALDVKNPQKAWHELKVSKVSNCARSYVLILVLSTLLSKKSASPWPLFVTYMIIACPSPASDRLFSSPSSPSTPHHIYTKILLDEVIRRIYYKQFQLHNPLYTNQYVQWQRSVSLFFPISYSFPSRRLSGVHRNPRFHCFTWSLG